MHSNKYGVPRYTISKHDGGAEYRYQLLSDSLSLTPASSLSALSQPEQTKMHQVFHFIKLIAPIGRCGERMSQGQREMRSDEHHNMSQGQWETWSDVQHNMSQGQEKMQLDTCHNTSHGQEMCQDARSDVWHNMGHGLD
ncbi:unnamed protein product [Lupinus luteus]|uniref:Uncharacterized protein n=1 Tax=Lupinus luteus TaxID=3873 RepID=A0AAV1YIL4_LUPLU